jgi:hypothetical protein
MYDTAYFFLFVNGILCVAFRYGVVSKYGFNTLDYLSKIDVLEMLPIFSANSSKFSERSSTKIFPDDYLESALAVSETMYLMAFLGFGAIVFSKSKVARFLFELQVSVTLVADMAISAALWIIFAIACNAIPVSNKYCDDPRWIRSPGYQNGTYAYTILADQIYSAEEMNVNPPFLAWMGFVHAFLVVHMCTWALCIDISSKSE